MKKMIFPLLLLLIPAGGFVYPYSIFNTRGLGGYTPPGEFLSSAPRQEASIGAYFLADYAYASDNRGGIQGFIFRPQGFSFFVPLPWKFGLSAQITERYNLDFEVGSDSVTSANYTLIRKITGRGGLQGLRLALDKSIYNVGYLRLGYERLFGGAWERWDSEIIELNQETTDSLLYHFGGNGVHGVAGASIGPVTVRGFYGLSFDLRASTEVQTFRDTAFTDSAFLVPPSELGGFITYSPGRFSATISYLQLSGGDGGSIVLNTGHLVQGSAGYAFDAFTLQGKAGYHIWNARTPRGSAITDLFAGLGFRIPIQSYGYGIVGLEGGLRQGADISEYHAELKLGLEFTEPWEKRERMWGG